MTVIGIGGCMGLILVGFGLQDSITAIAKNQFVNLFTYEANVILDSNVSEAEKEAQQIVEADGKSVSLGKTTLRTETAGLAAIAMTLYELEL